MEHTHTTIKRPRSKIRLIELLRLALAHMSRRKARTAVTVGGMAIGIAVIVFLVSIGYGLQELVINRVAKLEELRQINVAVQQGSQLKLNDETLAAFRDLPAVEQVLPLISVVGRVNFQNSTSDVAAFGVTTDYLNTSATQPTRGRLFENDHLTLTAVEDVDSTTDTGEEEGGEVQGIRDVQDEESQSKKVTFSIQPDQWVVVRAEPTRNAPIIGYTWRVIGGQQRGSLVSGSSYQSVDSEVVLTEWIHATVPLWSKTSCVDDECGEQYEEQRDDGGDQQVRREGYVGLNFISWEPEAVFQPLQSQDAPHVLGITTGEAPGEEELTVQPSGRVLAGTLELIELEGESDTAAESQIEQVVVTTATAHETVVNRQFLEVLGIAEESAVDTTFSISFVVVSSLLEDASRKVESVPVEYKIVGVIPEEGSPAVYVPFIDVRSLGIASYSQIKLVMDNQEVVPDVRSRIEAMGYTTSSVLDTVAQINSFFATARVLLALVGTVALVIAALGMFNTLTVSLLERTHEVGLMKAIGMKSREVRKLFLVESLTMGFLGGVVGLGLGYLAGLIASAVLSSVALAQGAEAVAISSIPFYLVLGVLALALVVGVVTGFYPARRATRISALNALRYE